MLWIGVGQWPLEGLTVTRTAVIKGKCNHRIYPSQYMLVYIHLHEGNVGG